MSQKYVTSTTQPKKVSIENLTAQVYILLIISQLQKSKHITFLTFVIN